MEENKMKTRKSILKVILAVMLVILAAMLLLFSIPSVNNALAADAENTFTGVDPSKTLAEKSSELKYNNTTGSKAVLTVLLPDLGEDASAWSSSLIKKFSYDENSLPERLKADSNGDLYSAVYSNDQLYITQLNNYNYTNQYDYMDNFVVMFSEYSAAHKIIMVSFTKLSEVYEDIAFDTAYAETEKLINLVLYDLKKTGVVRPTVNIIGHGRGGLLGIKYANNYPTTVNSIFNIGTPHNGSDTLQLLKTLKDKYNVNIASIESLLGGRNIYEYADENSELLTQLKNDWNNNTIVKNPQIMHNTHAIAGVMDGDHFKSIGELTSIFSSIDSSAQAETVLEILADENNKMWCSRFIGESERSVLSAFNEIKGTNGLLSNDTISAVTTIIMYLFADEIHEKVKDPSGALDPLSALGVGICLSLLKTSYDDNASNWEEYKKHDLTGLQSSIYNVLSAYFTDKEIFGYDMVDNKKNYNKKTVFKMLDEKYFISDIFNKIVGSKDTLVTVSKICNVIGKAMNNVPVVDGITAGISWTLTVLFLRSLVSDGLLTAAVVDGMNGDAVRNFLDDIDLKSQTELAESEIFLFKDKALFMSDLVAEYDSQIATGYGNTGFQHYTKLFGASEVNINKSSRLGTPLPFAHYLETMDSDIIQYIEQNIGIESAGSEESPYFYTIDYKDEITITGLRKGVTLSDTLTIPSEIDGMVVKYIGRKAFANTSIKNVTMPNSIISIGDMAFYNCTGLTTVTLPSDLETIGDNAFLGCALNCTVQIGASVNEIGETAFGGCNAVFDVAAENQRYSSVDGSLYNYEKNYLIKFGKEGSNLNVTLPDTLLEIAPYAFAENKRINTISMGSVQTINEFAFACSSLTTISNANSVEFVVADAFKDTPWLNNNNTDYITLNNMLIQYKGTNIDVIMPDNISRIADNAFAGKEIKSVRFPENIDYIGKSVFDSCADLQSVEFRGQHVPTVVGLLTDGLGHSLEIYVPYLYRSLYVSNMSVQYENSGFKYWCTIKYLDPTNSNFYATEEFRDTDLPLSLVGKSVSGVGTNFAGWSKSSTQYDPNFTITECKDITVYAFYNYILTFELIEYGETVTKNAVYSTTFTFPTIDFEEYGYYFTGWHEVNYGANYSAEATTGVVSRQSNLTFKAQWSPKRYELKVGNNDEFWIYIEGESRPLLSTTQKWVYFGDEINIKQLIELFNQNRIGVIEGKYIIDFSFNDPEEVPPIPGPGNADADGDREPRLSIPDLGPNNNSVKFYSGDANGATRAIRKASAEQKYYLYPKYDDERYFINLYVDDNNTDGDYYNYGDTLPIINKEHCDFLGWTRTRYNTIPVTEEKIPYIDYNTVDIFDFTPGEGRVIDSEVPLTLYGLYRAQCAVTFKTDDGIVLEVQYVSLNEAAIPPSNPTKLGYMFDGWDNDGYTHVTDNLTITALFSRKTYTIAKGYTGTKIFSDTAVYVDCSNRTRYAVYQIEPSVQVITFEKKSGGEGSIFNLNYQRIVVSSRSSDLTIILKNYYGQAEEDTKALDATGAHIELYCIGSSTLIGGFGTDTNSLSLLTAGIVCGTLTITGEQGARLTVKGGQGANGKAGTGYSDIAANDTRGASGTDGTDGAAGGMAIVCNNLSIRNIQATIEGGKGGTGGAGGNGQGSGAITSVPNYGVVGATGYSGGAGGNGGAGGMGGSAVFMLNIKGYFTVESSATVTLLGGNGGKGGAGGKGGSGGNGGKGGPGKFGTFSAKGGTGGTGGNGGNGGAGGGHGTTVATLGVAVDFGNASVTQRNGSCGIGGSAGAGGVGGAGGEGGTKWPTGNLADSGAAGAHGDNGQKGSDCK